MATGSRATLKIFKKCHRVLFNRAFIYNCCPQASITQRPIRKGPALLGLRFFIKEFLFGDLTKSLVRYCLIQEWTLLRSYLLLIINIEKENAGQTNHVENLCHEIACTISSFQETNKFCHDQNVNDGFLFRNRG